MLYEDLAKCVDFLDIQIQTFNDKLSRIASNQTVARLQLADEERREEAKWRYLRAILPFTWFLMAR